jgi:hypothetical protein
MQLALNMTATFEAVRCPPSDMAQSFVGCRHPPLPEGFAFHLGWLMSDYQTSPMVYGFSVVSNGTLRMLWLERSLGTRQSGEPYWEVLAVLPLPILTEAETFVRDTCRYGASPTDPEIFGIAAVKPEGDTVTHVRVAWRANRLNSTFEPIPSEGLNCLISFMEYWR